MRWQYFRLFTLCCWLARASAKSVFLAVRPDAPAGEAKDHGQAMAPARLARANKGDGKFNFLLFLAFASSFAFAALGLAKGGVGGQLELDHVSTLGPRLFVLLPGGVGVCIVLGGFVTKGGVRSVVVVLGVLVLLGHVSS